LKEQTKLLEVFSRILSDSPELETALSNRNLNRIYDILIPVKYYSNYEELRVYDQKLQIIARVASPVGSKIDKKEQIKLALTGITTSGMEISQSGLELFVITPVHFDPIKEVDKMPPGVLAVYQIVDKAEMLNIKEQEGVEINVFHHGELVFSTIDSYYQDDVMLDLASSWRENGQFIVIEGSGNKEYINAWRDMGEGNKISVMVPNDELLDFSRGFSGDIIIMTVIAGIIVLLSSLILAKLFIRPLVRMLDTTVAITCGDFDRKVEVFTQDEFGKLGEAINSMAEKVGERIEKAEYLATVDGLTGLYNHRYFQQKLEQEITKAASKNKPLSLIFIDIDYFKHYNDTQGHPAGDLVLQEISKIIRQNIRGVDTAARYGGEEFALILPGTGDEDAVMIGERIRAAVETHPFIGREEQPAEKLTISLGVSTYPVNAREKGELIKMADDALYKAKYISKNRVVLYYSVLDELKKELDRSDQDMLNSIKTLISVINSKDKYTFGHSERVVRYSVMMAEGMRLNGEETKILKIGAYLHDIGKIEISREILNKEGPLTSEEMEILWQHPTWGAQIVSPVESLKHVVSLILYHHEKYDGTGYPEGLKGSEIPLLARILKVADSFDAMTTARPYREKKTFSQAVEELRLCAGTDFDPYIVDTFINTLGNLNKADSLVS